MCKALITVTPSPQVGTLNYLKKVGGGTEWGVKEGALLGVRGHGGRSGGAGAPTQESLCLHISVHTTWGLKTDPKSAYFDC